MTLWPTHTSSKVLLDQLSDGTVGLAHTERALGIIWDRLYYLHE